MRGSPHVANARRVSLHTDASRRSRATPVVFLCFVVVMIDGYDTIMVSFIAPLLQHAYTLNLHDIARLFAMGYVGTIIGALIAGWFADRVGRTMVTSWAMAISGSCCLIIGLLFGANPILLLIVAAIWGASVVADSAQFSTCVTELGDPQYIGTALTIQTCLGFLLTTISIELVPHFVKLVGWRYAFMVLAPGPFLGVMAMLRLRGLPEARKIAQGRR